MVLNKLMIATMAVLVGTAVSVRGYLDGADPTNGEAPIERSRTEHSYGASLLPLSEIPAPTRVSESAEQPAARIRNARFSNHGDRYREASSTRAHKVYKAIETTEIDRKATEARVHSAPTQASIGLFDTSY